MVSVGPQGDQDFRPGLKELAGPKIDSQRNPLDPLRSEERRVGKECRL